MKPSRKKPASPKATKVKVKIRNVPKSAETDFTREIRTYCDSVGISIRTFLKSISLPTSALYRWETGHKPRESMVKRVREGMK